MQRVPGGQKRKSDFATEDEWKAYKAELKAKEDARSAAQAAIDKDEELERYKAWEAERLQAAFDLLSSWQALYTAAIATNNLEVVRSANRLHRATYSVLLHLLDDETIERWFEVEEATDPLEELPELFERAILGETRRAMVQEEPSASSSSP